MQAALSLWDWWPLWFGSTPKPPKPAAPPPPPPPPLPPAAVQPDTAAQEAVTREGQRVRRRYGVRNTILSGAPIGTGGDRPLGT